jgi:hypothetical protein
VGLLSTFRDLRFDQRKKTKHSFGKMLGLTPRRRLVCFRLINAAGPLPLIDVDWNASALPDRADMHVAVIDVPSHTVRIGGASAGEDGQPHLFFRFPAGTSR